MDFYHVLNRGVDKREIVLSDTDCLRFMQGLYLYNDKNLLNRNIRRFNTEQSFQKTRQPLVTIHAFCLMKNHYHLLLSPVDNEQQNLSAFMRKLNMGYAKYFNEKYERSGALWQGKYKSIHLEQDAHFLYIPYYIHLNPLDYLLPNWREGTVTDIPKALTYLKQYRWSSYLSYQTGNHYKSVLDTTFIGDMLGTPAKQDKTIAQIMSSATTAALSDVIE
jgi:putative transposase